MTYTIVYSSRTGNTKLLADGIRSVLPAESCVYFGPVSGAEREAAQADVVFAGFWTDKGSCDEEMAGFLSGIVGKDVFLFGTAGFGGSGEYFSKILRNVGKYLDGSCRLAGTFMCQGQMLPAVRKRYEGMVGTGGDVCKVREMIENYDRALGHPNEADVEGVKREVTRALAGWEGDGGDLAGSD